MTALQPGATLNDIVTEALKPWLEDREHEADAAAMDEVAADERFPWEQAKAEIAAMKAERTMSQRGRQAPHAHHYPHRHEADAALLLKIQGQINHTMNRLLETCRG